MQLSKLPAAEDHTMEWSVSGHWVMTKKNKPKKTPLYKHVAQTELYEKSIKDEKYKG